MNIKSVLIITYDWMPRNSIAVQRPYAWAKYWSAKGVSVTILTAKKYAYDEPLDLELPEIVSASVIEVPYRNSENASSRNRSKLTAEIILFAKKHKDLFKKIFRVNYDIRDAWAKKATTIALDLHSKNNFDLIASTFGPRACHIIANKIKCQHPEVTWVADYRDMWSILHNSNMDQFQKRREQAFEKEIVSPADILTTVSLPLALELSKFLQKKVHAIPNGFDANWEEIKKRLTQINKKSINHCKKIDIVYTGMIYPGWRDPTPLFMAINNLIALKKIDKHDIHVHFFGQRLQGLDTIVYKNGSHEYVTSHGHVSRENAIKEQESADLLLLLESERPEAKGVLTGKMFEYMISGKPILSIGSTEDSAIGQIIAETGTGAVCGKNPEKIMEVLLRAINRELKEIYNPNLEAISKYDRKKQSNDLLKIAEDTFREKNKA